MTEFLYGFDTESEFEVSTSSKLQLVTCNSHELNFIAEEIGIDLGFDTSWSSSRLHSFFYY
jgi:hypothetical protein